MMASNAHVSTSGDLQTQLISTDGADTIIVDADMDMYSIGPATMQGIHVLDANGHTLTIRGEISPSNLTLTGNGTYLRHEDNYYGFFSVSNGNLTIENGTFLWDLTSRSMISISGNNMGTMRGNITIKGGYFETKSEFIHMQTPSVGTHTIVVNGGVFVCLHDWYGAFSGPMSDQTAVTLNKCVIYAASGKPANLYSGHGTTITIPAGSTYVLDGAYHSNIAESIEASNLSGGVLYVGSSASEFSLFNLMGNNHASTHVYGQTSGGGAYGHQAHSAVFVTATPESGYHGITFTTSPAQTLQVRDLGNNTYCIMPYTAGMTVSASAEQNIVNAIDILTKEGCIPAVGEHFWNRKSNSTECATVLSWSEGVYASAAFWYDANKENLLESSAVCAAGQTYYLYIQFYTLTDWEWGLTPTATVDGNAASINGFHEVYYEYKTTSTGLIHANENENENENKNENEVSKRMVNGQLVIERDGATYNTMGARL